MPNTICQDFNQLKPVPIQSVTVEDSFWAPKRKAWQEVTIPDCFTKFENDRGGAFNNFDRVRDGKSDGHAGPPWYDGLIYEMIRGSADFLAANPDPVLERRIDGYIARIAAAQERDTNGYLNTWTELQHPNQRWGLNGGNDGYQHEMYNVGAACEAAVHYYQATGKTSLLKVAVKLANFTCDQVGPSPRYELVPNHAIVEEAFANLYLFFREHPALKRDMPLPLMNVDTWSWPNTGSKHGGVSAKISPPMARTTRITNLFSSKQRSKDMPSARPCSAPGSQRSRASMAVVIIDKPQSVCGKT
jgi:Beta-L-arabinofuranosidase, GH127